MSRSSRQRRGQSADSSRTTELSRRRIKQAAAMVVAGKSMAQTAQALGMKAKALYRLREVHRELWNREFQKVKARFNARVEREIEDRWDARLVAIQQARAETSGRARPERPEVSNDLSIEMTLTEFFWSYAWPDVLRPRGVSERTRGDYVGSLRYWKALTGNPPIGEITKRTFSQFMASLAELPGVSGESLAANTVFKHWANLQRLLEWTGPAGRHNPNGAGLVAESVWLQSPRKEHNPPRPRLTLEEIASWLRVLPQCAEHLPKMNGFPPAAWWRALILLGYNTGMRPGTLFRVRWEHLEGQVLRIPTSIIKGRHGRFLWLNEPALKAIEPLRRESGLVFAWEGWPSGETTLKTHRTRQQRAAGIRPLSFYALRRAFATECAKINPMAAQLMMGHEGPGTKMMIDHYIDPEDLLASALAKMAQPEKIAG